MWIVSERHRGTGLDGERKRERERGRQKTSGQIVDLVYILCVRDRERQG